jgi:lysozyme
MQATSIHRLLLCCAAGVAISGLIAGCRPKESAERFPTVDTLTPGIFLDPAERAVPPGIEVRKVYARGLAVTKASEGFRRHLYNDAAGYCTIAYGHLVKKARCDGTESHELRRGLSQQAGEHLLIDDMATVRWAVMSMTTTSLSDGQFAALCDFAYNIGPTALRKSTLLKRVNSRRFAEVPAQFRRWVLAKGRVLPGLEARREREIELFFEGLPIPRPAPREDEDLEPVDIQMGETPADTQSGDTT